MCVWGALNLVCLFCTNSNFWRAWDVLGCGYLMVILLEAFLYPLPPFWKIKIFYWLNLLLADSTCAIDWLPCCRRLLWSIMMAFILLDQVRIAFIQRLFWGWCWGCHPRAYFRVGAFLGWRSWVFLIWRELFFGKSLYGFES